MYSSDGFEGFSVVKPLIIILVISALVAGGILGAAWYLGKQQAEAAVAFTNTFVANIQNQNYSESYDQLDGAAQENIGSASNWASWVQSIEAADVKIDNTPITTEQVASNTYTSFYLSSSQEGLSVTVTKKDNIYLVTDYRIEDEPNAK